MLSKITRVENISAHRMHYSDFNFIKCSQFDEIFPLTIIETNLTKHTKLATDNISKLG